MALVSAHVADWLLQAAATLPDTLYTKSVGGERSLFEKITSIASGLMTLSLLVLTAALVPAAWNFRKSYKKISDLLDRVYGDINPIVRHAHSIADNLDYVTTSIRVDVQQVNQTVALANEKLLEAVHMAERRMGELNALLGVVQEEAEDMFVATASTLRGVRTGAATLRREVAGVPAGPVRLDEDPLGELSTGEIDGNDSSSTTDGGQARPRIRSRIDSRSGA